MRQSFPLITTFSFIFVFSFLIMLSTLPKSFPITSKGIEDQSTGHHLIQVKRWASSPVYFSAPCADLCSKPALWSAMQGEVVQVLILHLHCGLKMALPKAYEIIDCDYHFSSGRVWTWCRGGVNTEFRFLYSLWCGFRKAFSMLTYNKVDEDNECVSWALLA